ncbi:hypothetical protein N9A86_00510 [Akkermansiaceae bacterium]|nr:hypothetical protein [Akkermansiaceae bacterium]MDB4544502.1 hypothetical protein [Akkermansiaceae bacterium]
MLRFLTASWLVLNASATDLVTLNNGDLFKGEVLGLADDTIQLSSPHSSEPLQIVSEKLRHIRFDDRDLSGNPTHSQLINLKNGDSLPGQITGLSDTTLSFNTWFAGPLEIARKDVDSVFFGVTPQKLLYEGPKSIESWEQDNNKWRYMDGTLRAIESGPIGLDFALPEDFILTTTVGWSNSPKMKIHLCSDTTSTDQELASNNYVLTISTSGLELERQLSKEEEADTRYYSLISSKQNFNDFKSGHKTITVELRVNRREGIIHLYLDGEYIKQGIDPKTPPTGRSVIYECLSAGRSGLYIKDIQMKEWDTVTHNLRRESRADEKDDTLATGDGDRFSGSVTDFQLVDDLEYFHVSSPLLSEPLAVPVDRCSVLYFSAEEKQEPKRPPFKLAMIAKGSLSLSEVTLSNDALEAAHPALGKLKLDRRILSEITRQKQLVVITEEDKTSESE